MRHAAWNSGLCRQARPQHPDSFVDTLFVPFVVFVQYDIYVPNSFFAPYAAFVVNLFV